MKKQELELQVKKVVSDISGYKVDAITNESDTSNDLDLDSLDKWDLVGAIEKEFNISIDDEVAEDFEKVQDYIDIVAEKLNIGE